MHIQSISHQTEEEANNLFWRLIYLSVIYIHVHTNVRLISHPNSLHTFEKELKMEEEKIQNQTLPIQTHTQQDKTNILT